MTVLHSGTNKKYSDNWAKAFGERKKTPAKAASAKASGGKKKKKSLGKKR